MATTEFSWLHLSDLHWNEDDSMFVWPHVKDDFYRDLKEVHKDVGHIDVIIFSGDMTYEGKETEFTKFTEEMKKLIIAVDTLNDPEDMKPNVKLLCVPGNHDLSRPDKDEIKKHSLEIFASKNWCTDEEFRKSFFKDKDNGLKKFIEKRFENYSKFLKHSKLPFLNPYKEGYLPGDFSAAIEKNGYKVGFIGLNSAFLQLRDKVKETETAVDKSQIQEVCDGTAEQWCKNNKVNVLLLLTHHPPEWLGKSDTGAQGEFYPYIHKPGIIDAHLCGHIHIPETRTISEAGGNFRRYYRAVSLFGSEDLPDGKKRIYGYSAGKLIINNDKAKIVCWPRIGSLTGGKTYRIHSDTYYQLKNDRYFESDKFTIKHYNPEKNNTAKNSPGGNTTSPLPPSTFLGREYVINDILTLLKDPKRRLITLFGPPGIGKTSIALAVKEKLAQADFKDGVYFCSFQEIVTLDSLIAKINTEVANINDAKEDSLFGWLSDKNCLLILDNFEDPLADKTNKTKVHNFIRNLIAQTHDGVKLLVTTRESMRLSSIEKTIDVKALTRTDSEALLRKLAEDLALAGYLTNKNLTSLLDQLGDVPLAIVLAAPNLDLTVEELTKQLNEQNLDVLCEGGIDLSDAKKDQSLCKSYSLSYSKLNANDRLLFHVCSLFPAGLTKDDAGIIVNGLKTDDFTSLTRKSLILTTDGGNTYTMLAPIRTYAYGMFQKLINENKIDRGIEKRWYDLCIGKSQAYEDTTRGSGKEDIKHLINELPDMFRVIEYLISKSEKDVLLRILINLKDFSSFVGITTEVKSSFEKAREIAVKAGDILGQANCIMSIGDIHLRESRNIDALNSYNTALPLYKQIGAILGQANCIMSIGDIHLRESRNIDALNSYNTALPLYKQIGAILGQANCIRSIGDIHLSESRNIDALNSYNTALPLYKQIGDILGQANCIMSIGDIHLRESRNIDALNSYNTALPLYKQIGAILGQANCIRSLGLCFIRDNSTDAGIAGIKAGISEVFRAIKLYEQIRDNYSIGAAYKQLGHELEGKAGFQEEALEYKKKGQEILDSIERALP